MVNIFNQMIFWNPYAYVPLTKLASNRLTERIPRALQPLAATGPGVYRSLTFQRLSLATSLHGEGGKSSSGAGAFCRIVPSPIVIPNTISFS